MRRLTLLLLLISTAAVAQQTIKMTQVTAVVQDANGNLYSGCQWSVVLSPGPGGATSPAQVLGGQQGQCDSKGNLSVSLADNNLTISPGGSQWSFSICSASTVVGGPYCKSNIAVTVTGPTMNLTSAFQPLVPVLPTGSTSSGGAFVMNSPGIPRSLLGGTAVVYGDSVGTGNGASSPQRSFGYLISNTMLWSLTNSATSGTQLQDSGQANSMLAATVSASTINFFMTGYNDMRAYGNGAGMTTYLHTLNNLMVWLSLPSASKVLATNAAVTKTGTWASTGPNFGRNQEFSATNGDTATWTSPNATAIYIGAVSNATTNCNYSVSVDGVTQISNVVEPTAIATVLGQTLGLYLIRVGGLASTTHTVVYTVGNSTKNCFLDYFASNAGVTSSGPYLFLGKTIRMNATGYAIGGGYGNGSDAIVAQYGVAQVAAAAPLQTDGLNITVVDDSTPYNPATMAISDNIHPNDTGHLMMANAFLGAATAVNQILQWNGASFQGGTAYDDYNSTYTKGLLSGSLGSAYIDTRNRRELMTLILDGISVLTSQPETMGGGPSFVGTHGWKECYVSTGNTAQSGCRGYGSQGTIYDMIPAGGWYTILQSAATPANDNATATTPDTNATFSVNSVDGAIVPKGRTFATLPAYPNGTICYCSDCNSTCTAGSSTGKWCQRVSAAWAVAF
jgi:hypothetical protein